MKQALYAWIWSCALNGTRVRKKSRYGQEESEQLSGFNWADTIADYAVRRDGYCLIIE